MHRSATTTDASAAVEVVWWSIYATLRAHSYAINLSYYAVNAQDCQSIVCLHGLLNVVGDLPNGGREGGKEIAIQSLNEIESRGWLIVPVTVASFQGLGEIIIRIGGGGNCKSMQFSLKSSVSFDSFAR